MGRLKFLFDKEKDAWNIWSKVNNKFRRFGKVNISQSIINASKDKTLEDAEIALRNLNKKLYDSGLIDNFNNALGKSWKKVEKDFFIRLKKLTGKELRGNFKAYTTSIGICPYNYKERWFMVSVFYSLPKAMSSLGHELLHIHFHDYYFADIEKKIGTEKTHDLREALTVLLNLEFKDLLFGFDDGYEVHKELREFISFEWSKNKDFDMLLEKCVARMK
ncbi:Uncharacterised protein [uncultured archaeon]|nr:Uncharacterised protein [uncultured archaeon]